MMSPLILRRNLLVDDRERVRRIVASTGFFTPAEIDIAVELVDERAATGAASGYEFVLADDDAGTTIGYACYGHIAGTKSSYDLYWIAVDARHRGSGVGRTLLIEAERLIAASGGERVYIETSSRDLYEPTRAFYVRRGYEKVAVLPDFYGPGDGKIIYAKVLVGIEQQH
jgi:ribosomal protein S18 acetylase RimI-like enzyme